MSDFIPPRASQHIDSCYRSEDPDEECSDSCRGIYDEVESLRAENEELKAMLGKGPYVPLHQYENLRAECERLKAALYCPADKEYGGVHRCVRCDSEVTE